MNIVVNDVYCLCWEWHGGILFGILGWSNKDGDYAFFGEIRMGIKLILHGEIRMVIGHSF